jgi:hypothetical protein
VTIFKSIMLKVVMPSVVMLAVVVPKEGLSKGLH